MIPDSEASNDDLRPDEFIAEFESRIREIEAAGGQAPEGLKHQLQRMKRLLAEGGGEGIRFMQAGDGSSGLMGFSLPLDPADVPRDSERGAT